MLYHNYNLKHLNTFGLDIKTDQFLEVENAADYISFLESSQLISEPLILGGGSNLLFLEDFKGIIIHPTKQEITVKEQDASHVWVEASAAIVWDDMVEWAVKKGFGGIENLTDIPGCVGASPVQNIGAYGAEAKDTIERVKGFYLTDGRSFDISKTDCDFGYRDSIFKRELKNKVVITSVIFKLNVQPKFNLTYGNLEEKVKEKGEVNLQNVRSAVREIRAQKLPTVEELGNAGSFFKNPVIPISQYDTLKSTFKNIPGYKVSNNQIKVPAAWLIEQCGLKGKMLGKAKVYEKQPLVIVNTGGASGIDIYNLAQQVISAVSIKFSILLHPEVNIIS